MRSKTIALIYGVLAAVLLGGARDVDGQQRFSFIGVGEDTLWQRADSTLRRLITDAPRGFEFVGDSALLKLPYDVAIETLVGWPDTAPPFLARTTPYVFTAAELRGARLRILAVVKSVATDRMTYRSYVVVNRQRYEGFSQDVAGVRAYLRMLRESNTDVEFIYHNRFSTSSYFLPSLFFRQNNISSGGGGITTRKIGSESSKDLVRAVASQTGGKHSFAAVWTGTEHFFKEAAARASDRAANDDVYFIELPTELPNDLLVVPSWADPPGTLVATFEDVVIGIDDFESWTDIDSPEGRVAQAALAGLRRSARQNVTPLVVHFGQGEDLIPDSIIEAARMAVQLSGGEFTPFDPAFHVEDVFDYEWTIELPHDQAATIRSEVSYFQDVMEPQEFHISYRDLEDLTGRIGTLMRTRLHRVRYLWPYANETPTVLRDVDFGLQRGDTVFVRRIEIEDALRADIGVRTEHKEQPVRIERASLYTFELDAEEVRRITQTDQAEEGLGLDPMSRVAYRVVLVRPAEQRLIFKVLTVVMLILFGLAAWWAVPAGLIRRKAA